MATEPDPKLAVIRKIDAHREVLVAEVDVLRYKLRPFGVIGSAAGWIGKAMAFRTPKVSRATSRRGGLDLESMVWLGIPIVRYLLGRRKRK
jgi:hypothetical protein